MFWRRTLSIVVLLPLILLIIYYGDLFGGLPFLLLISAAIILMQIEYCRLAGNFGGNINPVIPTILTVAFGIFGTFLPTSILNTDSSNIIFCYFILVFIYAFAASIFRGKVEGELRTVTLKLTGILTIGWVFGYHCILLRKVDAIGMQLIFLLIGTIWCSDTGAYLIGKAVGKHKLSTPISPRKTVEGTIAGILVGTLVSIALGKILLMDTLTLANVAFIGLLLSILGQLGDLSVSLMKRTAGVKDSGDYIPGHGGFLDRCDSLIFSAPVLYYYLTLTGSFS